ncbi:MAG TPA: phosphotransferase family protein [Thermoanaerobaculia bacterium]|nr:phosphotransferase family protein [Thermoanaerobaculia bacterium]
MIDSTRAVRPGEEIDAAPLAAWLKERLPGVEGPIAVEQFPGGHSNLTYLLRFSDRELVLRRPPFGSKVKTAHDMGREYRVLSRLYTLYPKAPQALLHCDDPEVIGAPFYLMERMRGIILRQQKPPAGIDLHPQRMRAISEAAVDGLAELHAVDYRAVGLDDLGHPEGYVARQVAGWSERWRRSRTDDIPELDRAAAWLADHQPAETGAALIHNDYKYDNLVLHPMELERIVAVLDWEMATVGDPLMDLGTSLGYWMDPDDAPALRLLPAGPTTLPGNLRRAEVVERYAATGRDVSNILFYYVFGLFKIAVIAQQIYFRYQQGLTKDERFAALIGAVRILGHTAAQAIDKGRIDRLA